METHLFLFQVQSGENKNNEVIEFVNPIQGSILPVSVVQVYSTDTGGGISNLVALS